ncbi:MULTISPECIES: DegV family protein [unclassified Candidatus Paralachnospira]|uniref:DegV family protein n=1 Tax=unclassified Candidatus Paralachnospira TaxID=3099471 RepID=UPI003F8EB174
MNYKIVVDSCCDLTEELKADSHFQIIPLTLQVGDIQITDDETFNQKSYLKLVRESEECPKTACPSPEAFMNAYDCDADAVFVVTLSQHLSGSYNSAVLGRSLYLEEKGEKHIAVFSSDSASVGEVILALKIRELCEAGKSFDEVVKEVSDYRDNLNTYFVLETLDFLRKNGRLTGIQAVVASVLNIKPVMGADKGTIIKLDQARGIDKALRKMAQWVAKQAVDPGHKTLAIAHTNCSDRARKVKEIICSLIDVKDVYVVNTAGVSSTYAGDGGVIIAL